MAEKHSTTKPPEFVYLTPETFTRLDAITRARVGRAIRVCPPEEMKGNMADVDPWIGHVGFVVDGKVVSGKGVGIIRLANQINVEMFKVASRPEMDWAAIPPLMIYDFLIWHEIGHVVMGHMKWCDDYPWNHMDKKSIFLAKAEMERRADRYAWGVLFPYQFLPKKKNPEISLKDLDKFAKKYRKFFEQPERSFEPLSCAPGDAVLTCHRENGIPWAEPVTRRLKFFKAMGEGLSSLFMALAAEGNGGSRDVPSTGIEDLTFEPATGVYQVGFNG
jgi:hypothetical protein